MTENKQDEKAAKELQTKYVEYQMIEQQLKQMQEQLVKFEEQIEEISNISAQLGELKETKPSTETLVPVANGIFMKGRILDPDELVVNVGAGVAVKKTVDETKQLLDEQAKEIMNYRVQVAAQVDQMRTKAQEIEQELQSMVK